MPDLDAGARKEPKQTSGAPHPGADPTSDGPEREARAVPTRQELEAQDSTDDQERTDEPANPPATDEEQR